MPCICQFVFLPWNTDKISQDAISLLFGVSALEAKRIYRSSVCLYILCKVAFALSRLTSGCFDSARACIDATIRGGKGECEKREM